MDAEDERHARGTVKSMVSPSRTDSVLPRVGTECLPPRPRCVCNAVLPRRFACRYVYEKEFSTIVGTRTVLPLASPSRVTS